MLTVRRSGLDLAPSSDTLPLPLTTRYEDEINKRTTAENEFVMLKKVGVARKTHVPAVLSWGWSHLRQLCACEANHPCFLRMWTLPT